jgi:endogenous inhibitor of DNA gyrase (YacG/DUF329 family)
MGVYDTVLVPCPKCGELYNAQSKSGDCVLAVYTLEEAPADVLENVNRHAPFQCDKCFTIFQVELQCVVKSVIILEAS